MLVGVAHTGSPQAPEIVPSAHCILRFRERMPIRSPGSDDVTRGLMEALSEADITRWPPGWAVSDRPAPLWAISGDLAFPLAPTGQPGRWLATTCLRRRGGRTGGRG
jgi:hypothetical protein